DALRRTVVMPVVAGLILCAPAAVAAQGRAPDGGFQPVGERYHVEVSGGLWNSEPFGRIASDSFDEIGSTIDFTTDLGFQATRLKEFRIVLRPTRRIRLRLQHTPIRYAAETSFTRNITFGGTPFPVSVPIVSDFTWKVWRGG